MVQVIGFVGASGGLGVSSLAAAYALVGGARLGSARVGLVDGDPRGRVDVTCGVDHVAGLRWPDLAALSGRPDGRLILARLPMCEGVRVLAGGPGPAPPKELREGVISALAGQLDLVVVDLGAHVATADDVVDGWVLVAGTGVRCLTDLESLACDVGMPRGRVHGVVTRGPARLARMGPRVARHVGMTHLLHVRDDPRVARDLEHGVPPRHRLAEAAEALTERLTRADAAGGGTSRSGERSGTREWPGGGEVPGASDVLGLSGLPRVSEVPGVSERRVSRRSGSQRRSSARRRGAA